MLQNIKPFAATLGIAMALFNVAAAAPVLAADLRGPVYGEPEPAVAYAYDSPYRWGGIYFGLDLGYVWSRVDLTETANGGTTSLGSTNPMNAVFGAHIGAMQQLGSFVYGAEVLVKKGDMEEQTPCTSANAASPPISATCYASLAWGAQAVGKIGYARDNMLLFVSAGAAVQSVGARMKSSEQDVSGSAVHSGVVLGGGFNYMLSPHQMLSLEYNHTDFGDAKTQYNWTNSGVSGTMNARPVTDEVRVGWSIMMGH